MDFFFYCLVRNHHDWKGKSLYHYSFYYETLSTWCTQLDCKLIEPTFYDWGTVEHTYEPFYYTTFC